MTLTFDNPPINEVALGRLFLPRPDFLVPHYGAFWQQIRARYPKAAHAPVIVDATDQQFIDLSDVSLPRVWFMAEDDTTLVQLQHNRFHFNWRQKAEHGPYVRFPAVREEFSRLWQEFEAYVTAATGQALQPVGAELTYINLIDVEDARSPFEIAEAALRDVVWAKGSRFLRAPAVFAQNLTFEIPDGTGMLDVVVSTVKRKRDGKQIVRLALTVRGKHSAETSFDTWTLEAHDHLVAAFKDLTNPAMHRLWKLKES